MWVAARAMRWTPVSLHRRGAVQTNHARHLCAPKRAAAQPRPKLPPPTPKEAAIILGRPIYSDEHVLAINKQSGLLSQPDASGLPTAHEAADALHKGSSFSPIHRLDKLATGCLILCKTRLASKGLGIAFAEQFVVKNYLAVVSGRRLRQGATSQFTTLMSTNVRGRIFVSEQHADLSWVKPVKQRETTLRYRTLATYGDTALVVASICGGYKHQIRAMLAYHGLPILGDPVYGGERWHGEEPFLALHAATMQVAHPIEEHAPLRLLAPIPSATWLHYMPAPLVTAAEEAVRDAERAAAAAAAQDAQGNAAGTATHLPSHPSNPSLPALLPGPLWEGQPVARPSRPPAFERQEEQHAHDHESETRRHRTRRRRRRSIQPGAEAA